MDLLKDITEQVRGNDREATDGHTDRRTSDRAPSNESRTPSSESKSQAGAPGDDDTAENSRESEHVCAFCRESFDAGRGACPHCGAEIVLRGVR